MSQQLRSWYNQMQIYFANFFDDPLNRLDQLRYCLNLMVRHCGMGIFYGDDWHFNTLTSMLFIGSFDFVAFSMYTIWYLRNDPIQSLQVFCCYGVFIPATMKLYLCLRFRRKCVAFLNFGDHLYLMNKMSRLKTFALNVAANRHACMQQAAKRTFLYVIGILMVFLTGAALFMAIPFWLLVSQGKRTWILPILIPFTELESTYEYCINIVNQILCSSLATCGSMGFDLYFAICICHFRAAVALFGASMDELVSMWHDKSETIVMRKRCLIKILIRLQDLDSYTLKFNKVLQSILLVQPIAASFSIVLSLFCIITSDWYSGYGYIVFTYTQLVSMCVVGQTVQNGNKELTNIIYCSHWYLFPIEQQKYMLNALLRTQSIKELWIGPYAPLNMETASAITQNMYTFAMMLLRVTT